MSIDLNPKLTNCGSAISQVKQLANLGIIFNERLTFTNHINFTVGKVYGTLRNLWTVQNSTKQLMRMLLAKTYLIPTLLYGCEGYCNCGSADSNKLKVTFNNIARDIFNKMRIDRISSFSYKIFNISFENYLKLRSLLLLQIIVYTKEPEYFVNLD